MAPTLPWDDYWDSISSHKPDPANRAYGFVGATMAILEAAGPGDRCIIDSFFSRRDLLTHIYEEQQEIDLSEFLPDNLDDWDIDPAKFR